MNRKISFFVIFLLIMISCGGETEQIVSETTTSTILDTTSTSSSTTTTIVEINEKNEQKCPEDDNSTIDFSKIKNIQLFLNKYGFDAGEPDGVAGNQTVEAIKEFQAYAGLSVDGDAGPNTIAKMNSWTGCEEKINDYIKQTTTTTVADSESSNESADTTTTTSTTTTTVPQSLYALNDFGFVPSLSLKNNEIVSIFKGYSDGNLICGTPYFGDLPVNTLNYFSNSTPTTQTVKNTPYTLSALSTNITVNSNTEIEIQIIGNGDTSFKFYFIKPFENQFIILNPSNIVSSAGLTTATFKKDNLENGAWFYGFAENSSGEIVKASGNREFLVGDASGMTNADSNEIETIIITKNGKNITKGENLNSSDILSILYVTKSIYNNRDNTQTTISSEADTITLKNDSQANVGNILLINKELMYINSKNSNNYTVTRGYLNTEIKEHLAGSSVKVIEDSSREGLKSNFGYAVIRSEKGFKFQIPLGPELSSNEFLLSGCPNDRYLLEEITTFSWRQKGSSTVVNSSTKNTITSLFDKEFVINTNKQYLSPNLIGKDSNTGNFLIEGPRNKVLELNDSINFNFNKIELGNSEIKFVEINFKMFPLENSNKLSSSKSIYLPVVDGNFNFIIDLQQKSEVKVSNSNNWEVGYKYIFNYITFFDTISKTKFNNDGTIDYGHNSNTGSHDVYYLDQFSFIVNED